jgi:hypothetical protein
MYVVFSKNTIFYLGSNQENAIKTFYSFSNVELFKIQSKKELIDLLNCKKLDPIISEENSICVSNLIKRIEKLNLDETDCGDILKENPATQQISTRISKPACADFVDPNKPSSQYQDLDN